MLPNHTPQLCECGCGQLAPIAKVNDKRNGQLKGKPLRFISGHNSRVANPSQPAPMSDRFWKYVSKGNETDCWLWQGSISNRGYGTIRINGRNTGAHRLSWMVHFGAIPEGMQVCHKCDIPNCVSPHHLFLGSGQVNMRDKIAKGRANVLKGTERTKTKLSDDSISTIRELADQGTSQRTLAKRFGVSQSQISRIVHKKHWKHIG